MMRVLEALREKHPARKTSSTISIDHIQFSQSRTILYDQLDGQLMRKTALKTDGADGPSGLDAAAWKCLCTSFQSASTDLCDDIH